MADAILPATASPQQTAPLNFSTSQSPQDIAAAVKYKELQLNTPINPNFFSGPDLKNFQQFTTPVEPFTTNLGLNDLWTKVWGPKEFLSIYKQKRNETKLQCPDWEFNADRTCALRLIKNIVIVDAPLPNTPTAFCEAHRVIAVQREGKYELFFQHSAQTPDVISGTTFRVELLMHATATSLNGPTTLTFTGSVLKMSAGFYAVKFMAVPRAMRETGDAMRLYCATLAEYTRNITPSAGGDGAGPEGAAGEAASAAPVAPPPMVYAPPPPPAPSPTEEASVLTTILPSVGVIVALGALFMVASSSTGALNGLQGSADLQNRRWSFVDDHIRQAQLANGDAAFGLAGVLFGGGSGGATAMDGEGVGGASDASAPYSAFVGGGKAAGGPSPSLESGEGNTDSTVSGTPRGGSKTAPATQQQREDTIPSWAHIVVGEVAALESRLATCYWLIGAQLVAMVGYVVKRMLS